MYSFYDFLRMGGAPYFNYGGSYFQDGGEPRQEDFPDYESYQAAMDQYLASMAVQQQSAPMMGGAPADYMAAPTFNQFPVHEQYADAMDAFVANGSTGAYGAPVVAPPQIQAPAAAPTRGLNAYSGVSVHDFLTAQGKSGSFASRKQLAQQLGIPGYRGTAEQNRQMMEMIRQNPAVLDDLSAAPAAGRASSGSKKKAGTPAAAAYQSPDGGNYWAGKQAYMNKSANGTPAASETISAESGSGNADWDSVLGGILGLGVAGAAASYLTRPNGKRMQDLANMAKARIPKEYFIEFARKNGRSADLVNNLRNIYGMSPKEVAVALKGVPLGTGATSALANPEAMKAFQQSGAATAETARKAFEAAQKEAQVIINQMRITGNRTPEMVKRLEKLVPNPAERAVMMKGIKFAPAAGPSAGAGFFNALKQAYGAARATPAFKLLRKEDGGMIPYYQDGGDSTLENIIEFLDPTGISSYDDAYRTWKDPNAAWWEKGLATVSALPIVGKFGKGAKAIQAAAKPVSKLKKAQQVAGKVMSPVGQMDQYLNPASRFVGSLTAQGMEHVPKYLRPVMQAGSNLNQGRRFFTGTDLMFGYKGGGTYSGNAYYQQGGPTEGDVMNVTAEQMEMLRQQGYQFEII
jgi:hypothetical protein